jgi:hypothetical protein
VFLLACHTPPPLARPYRDDLFVATGIDLAQAEARARQFCRERGEPLMRRVDKREVTIHVTGDPRIRQLELIFRCEAVDPPPDRP